MKIEEVEILNKPGLMIYVTKDEYCTTDFKDKLNQYKKKFKKVGIIISGDQPIEPILKKMVELYC